jgi:septum formation protein
MADSHAPGLVLASASPFRRRMLEAAGLGFTVVAPDVDEAAVKMRLLRSGSNLREVARGLAVAKAEDVSAHLPNALVIGADQVLACDAEMYNKPESVAEAREQLVRLRGKTHELHTAVALAASGKAVWTRLQTATLTMRPFSDAFLADYLARLGERVRRTVGAYEIEGPGIQLMEHIEGDMFTIIGLPLLALLSELRARGAIAT